MELNLQTLIPIILAILFLVFSGARRRKPAQQERRPPENTTQVEAQPDSQEAVFPPFTGNFEGFPSDETEMAQETVESEEVDLPTVAEPETVQDPAPEKKPVEPPPVPVDSRTPLPTKPMPGTSLIGDLSPETFRQGIILAEILGRPKTLRNPRW